MNLLKIGTLNLPRNRWLDALEKFEKVYVFCWDTEVELDNENFIYIKIPTKTFFNKYCLYLINSINHTKWLRTLERLCIKIFTMVNKKYLEKIPFQKIDFIHSSYNDFDESNLFTLMLPKKYSITRAQKETRINNNNLEYLCLKRCGRIILNDIECKKFFEEKYGEAFFEKKEVLLNLDEDIRYSKLKSIIEYDEKLSKQDGKIHAVILAGRVLSDKNDIRSGGRLYYLETIENLLSTGFVVHLHTKNIISYNGQNPYIELAERNKNFIIEPPLDFEGASKKAYATLSRYDIGILHAYISTQKVSLFDKVNIPHRYYEYLLAHVCPIVPKGHTIVTEKIFSEKKSGIIYENLSDITLKTIKNIKYENLFFKNYISSIY